MSTHCTRLRNGRPCGAEVSRDPSVHCPLAHDDQLPVTSLDVAGQLASDQTYAVLDGSALVRAFTDGESQPLTHRVNGPRHQPRWDALLDANPERAGTLRLLKKYPEPPTHVVAMLGGKILGAETLDPDDCAAIQAAIALGDGGEASRRYLAPTNTQQGATTPGHDPRDQAPLVRAERDQAAGNVSESQVGPEPDRADPPPSPPCPCGSDATWRGVTGATMTRFTLADLERANAAWGCNCGPATLAAVLDLTLDEVHQHFPDFPGHTNITTMYAALQRALGDHGKRWRSWKLVLGSNSQDNSHWPTNGLVRIQFEGPWMKPGVPPAARYKQTHWVGARRGAENEINLWDINALGERDSIPGWCSLGHWDRVIAPAIADSIRRADGKWHITHVVEINRST